jgi:type I restriction enzyme M protein
MAINNGNDKSLGSLIWNAACSIRESQYMPKYKDCILSLVFVKGDPQNYTPEDSIERIASTLLNWKEEKKFSRVVNQAEIIRNNYNISPSRYTHTTDAEKYRLINEIIQELDELETETTDTNKKLKNTLSELRVNR